MSEDWIGRMSGDGGFQHGDFAEPRPHGDVHIIQTVTGPTAVMSCGKAWWLTRLRPGNGDWPNQCAKCWGTF